MEDMADRSGNSSERFSSMVARLDRAIAELRHASFGYFGPARRASLQEATGSLNAIHVESERNAATSGAAVPARTLR